MFDLVLNHGSSLGVQNVATCNISVIAVENPSNLFQSRAFSFNKDKPYAEAFDDQNDNVDEVELPLGALESDGVDILVDDLLTISRTSCR